jgi:flagellar hook-associated protein 1 FlgK
MPGLFGSLNQAAKALQAQQVAIQVTGRNVANVNNPEYSRQRVLMGERFSVSTPTGPEGSGLEVLGVQQLRDTLLDRQVIRQAGELEGWTALQNALQNAELALGDKVDATNTPTSVADTSISASGLTGALDDFFKSMETLATSPSEVPLRDAAIQSAAIFSDRINNADNRLAILQDDLERQLSADAEKANFLLQNIALLNSQIRDTGSTISGGAADLIDRRQSQLEELGKLVNFEAEIPLDAPNVINVKVGGQVLVNYGVLPKGPNPIGYVAATPNTAGLYPANPTTPGMITISGANSSSLVSAGGMWGRYSAITGVVSQLRGKLSTLSLQLAEAVNSKYTPESAMEFFQTGNVTGLIRVNPLLKGGTLATGPKADPSATGTDGVHSNTVAGDNSYIKAITNIRTAVFSTALVPPAGATAGRLDGSLKDFVRTTVSSLAQSVQSANTRAEESGVIDSSLRAQRDSVSGVSLDEETTNLMQYQRAYQANAKVISVLDAMLDSLINSMVR